MICCSLIIPDTLSAQHSPLPWKSAMEFSHPKNLEKPIASLLLPYVEGVWEVEMHQELIQIQDSIYNKMYPQEFILRTKPQGDTQHMVHCVCNIQLECGRNCWGIRKTTSCVAWRTVSETGTLGKIQIGWPCLWRPPANSWNEAKRPTAGTGNIRSLHIWHAWETPSANPVWKSLLLGCQ